MAMSGGYGPYTGPSSAETRFTWTATNNFSNNTSTITQNVYLKNISGETASIGVIVITSIDGEIIENTISSSNYNINEEKLILTRSKTITNNNDGTRSVELLYRIKFYMTNLVGGTPALDNASNGNIKISSTWKKAFHWIKVSGTWKRAVMWTKISGVWKKGK